MHATGPAISRVEENHVYRTSTTAGNFLYALLTNLAHAITDGERMTGWFNRGANTHAERRSQNAFEVLSGTGKVFTSWIQVAARTERCAADARGRGGAGCADALREYRS